MVRLIFVVLALFMAAGASHAEPVALTAADGVKVYAEYWPATAKNAPLILAFHQAAPATPNTRPWRRA